MAEFASIVGMIGVVMVLAAYALLASGRWQSDELRYPILNMVGTAAIAYSLLYQWNLPSMIAQLLWIAVSLLGIMRILKARRAR